MAAPSPEEAAVEAVCCMCGDHGLPRELFRCGSCRVRQQHRYCSDLYPRATAYRRCNWCLREPAAEAGVVAAAGHVVAATAAHGSSNKPPPAVETKRKTATMASDDERRLQRHVGCCAASRRPPSEVGCCPVKKRRKQAAGDEGTHAGAKKVTCSSNAGERKELMLAGKARVKVQRYRLLAEVISC